MRWRSWDQRCTKRVRPQNRLFRIPWPSRLAVASAASVPAFHHTPWTVERSGNAAADETLTCSRRVRQIFESVLLKQRSRDQAGPIVQEEVMLSSRNILNSARTAPYMRPWTAAACVWECILVVHPPLGLLRPAAVGRPALLHILLVWRQRRLSLRRRDGYTWEHRCGTASQPWGIREATKGN